jgi:hypothetical protein
MPAAQNRAPRVELSIAGASLETAIRVLVKTKHING